MNVQVPETYNQHVDTATAEVVTAVTKSKVRFTARQTQSFQIVMQPAKQTSTTLGNNIMEFSPVGADDWHYTSVLYSRYILTNYSPRRKSSK
jgi:hypothetical protein